MQVFFSKKFRLYFFTKRAYNEWHIMKGDTVMKKFGKFLTGTVILSALAAGAFYVYKNFVETPDLDKDDDTLEVDDFDTEETEEPEDREYVSIDISGPGEKDEKDEEA